MAAYGGTSRWRKRWLLAGEYRPGCGRKGEVRGEDEGGKDREIEGIDGTKLEEVLVPSGKTRSVNYAAAGSAGTAKVKCYVPGGNSAIIELKVSK